jgi:prophage regulatory protein
MTERLQRILRRPQVLEATGYSRTQLQELIDKGEFPPPFPLSDTGRAVGWFEDDVVAWQQRRLAKRNAKAANNK